MARARGYKGFIGMGKETTYGTAVAATNYLRIKSESMTNNLPTEFDQALGSLHKRGPFTGKKIVRGDITTDLYYNGLELLMYMLFGYNNTPAVASSCGTWTWSSNAEAAALPVGLTINVNRDIAKFVFAGCFVEQARFNLVAADIAEVVWSMVGQTQTSTSDTCDTASYPADAPVLATAGVFKFNDQATARTNIKSGSIIIKNILAAEDYHVCGNTILAPVLIGRELSGEFTMWFESRADYTLFTAKSNVDLDLVYTGGLISGTTYYGWTFTFPISVVTPAAEPVVTGRGLIEQPFNIEGYYNASTEPMTITVVNAMIAAV
jgi:hypothetical protein